MTLQAKIAAAAILLERIQDEFSPATLASSLGAEDMVLTDLIAKHAPGISIFSLDTGRLNPETYDLLAKVQETYGEKVLIRVLYPQPEPLQQYVQANGINAFYHSVELRKACCAIRKVEPLKHALAGNKAWITGMRRQQAVTRADMPVQEFDADHGLAKFNPLADWTEKEVWEYIRSNAIPYNALHDKHYPSIGCAPCTRAIAVGEDLRAGRWWWENEAGKECGLHVKKI
ncbi:MAG TPA: phosphoadenylyl-sulfate reductase [Methylophilaceae bacterium]|nr:phosphoadenylyl-sulfate reductase [Methylophilaceae bacterium]HQR60245.1 phosphoadenylyl-sulfate reductase [Methylophilaceae bacterium]